MREYAKKFPDTITLLNNQHNLGLVKNTLGILARIREDGCEYVAMLDGDDYWCDCQKIQKQIDILNNDSSVGFVHTNLYTLSGKTLLLGQNKTTPSGNVFSEMGHFSIGNCTVLFRSNLLDIIDFNELSDYGFLSLDGVMYTLFSAVTNFSYLNETTAVWRRGHSSVSNTKNEQKQIAYLENERKMWSYLDGRFPGQYDYSDEGWQLYYNYKVFNIAFHFNDYPRAHALSRGPMSNSSLKLSIKRICARNRVLFKLWRQMNARRATVSQSI